MTNKQLIEELQKYDTCIEYKKREDDTGYYCFTYEAMDKNSDLYSYYRVLSDLIYNADVSTDYAYEWVSDTVTALIERAEYREASEDVDRDDLLDELYENLPEEYYTYNHGEFVKQNSWALDDAVKEWGATENLLAVAYRYAQENQCRQFADALLDTIEQDIQE